MMDNSTGNGEQRLRHGSQPLRPRARMIQAIGEDLISNEIIALSELIKNSYDADAENVIVRFRDDEITVSDDGHGMTAEVFLGPWLEPATAQKHSTSVSPKFHRRMTGEKGIGRFAAARLAKSLQLVSTTSAPARTLRAQLDWDAFRDESKYLDEIPCHWSEAVASTDATPGTTLHLRGVRDTWNKRAFERLRAELARLIGGRDTPASFSIILDPPESAEFVEFRGAIDPPPILDSPHYSLLAFVDASGNFELTGRTRDEDYNEAGTIRIDGRAPSCGPFEFELKAWDRDRASIHLLAKEMGAGFNEIRRDLNEASGISVYRDFFRVLPYGSPGDDWLRLDARRVNNPTLRLSNNQIVGAAYISADGNPDLRDQTNREGLVETQGLTDFKQSLLQMLALLEARRYKARPRNTQNISSQDSIFRSLDLRPIVSRFKTAYPNDTEFLGYLETQAAAVSASASAVQDVLARYRRLATLGQVVDSVLHDGRTPVAAIKNAMFLAKRTLNRNQVVEPQWLGDRFDFVEKQAGVLSNLFKRIEPFSGRKRGRPRKIILEEVIARAFEVKGSELDKGTIKVALPESKTTVTADDAEIQIILVNLIDNAIFWLQQVPPTDREISVSVQRLNDGLAILFSDSGPGVAEEDAAAIFSPYFSRRPNGVGLGLTIAGELASAYDGALELLSSALGGATFRVLLRRRIA